MAFIHLSCVLVGAGFFGLVSVAESSTSLHQEPLLSEETERVGLIPEQVVPKRLSRVDDAVRRHMMERDLVGVGIGVVQAGAISYLKGYGYQDREAEVPLLAQRSMIRWASISKPVTAIIASRLASQGVVDLDAPIETYFKAYRPPRTHVLKCKKRADEITHHAKTYPCTKGYADIKVSKKERRVTLRSLLAHTSGVRGYGGGRKGATPARKRLNNPAYNKGLGWGLKKVLRSPFAYMPGTEYMYSTFGFNLAAHVLEHATGESFPALIQKHVSSLANLQTLQPDHAWVDIPDRAEGYRFHKKKKEIVVTKTYDVSWKMAGGGLISTPRDLARFCKAMTGSALISDAQKAELWEEQVKKDGEGTDYGLGFGVGEKGGRRFVEHSGVQPKTRSHLRLYPEEELCIVVMSNTTTAKTSELVNAIDDALRVD